jgi:RimJ/RimL family protein N-acetyltransferase
VLEIRPVTADDTDALLQILGDPEVAYWLRPAGQSGPFSRAECEQIIVRKLAHWTAFGFGMSLAFSDGRCVGRSTVGYNLVDGRAEVEVGWAVVRHSWGRGLGAGRAGPARAAPSHPGAGFERIAAFTRPDNLASRRVMEKLGLQYQRDFTHAGHPHVLYVTPSPQ